MDVLDRKVPQGDLDAALHRVTFCLDHIERLVKSGILQFENEQISFYKNSRLTMEEVIGALVAAEQNLIEAKGFGE